MKARDEFLEALGLDASDGGTKDWDEVHASARGQVDRRLVENIRSLSMIADFYRQRREEADADVALGDEPWGQLELLEEIGCGSYGTVYRARDTQLNREVALKVVHSFEGDDTLVSSILQEGERMARVKHPNLVTIHGAQVRERSVGLSMEYIRGTTLHDLIADRGPMGGREATLLGCDLCGALAALHSSGLIHRDIKARNVMREDGGRVILMDLGAGVELRKIAEAGTAAVSGTPLYMAPEVLAGSPGSVQSDIYSLGVLLYFAVTGTYPLKAESLTELKQHHARGERRHLRDERPDLPSEFIAVIERSIAPKPADRFGSVGEMEQALSSSLGITGAVAEAPDPNSLERAEHRTPSFLRRYATPLGFAGAALAAAIALFAWPGFLVSPTYTVEASLHRISRGAVEELLPGARVAPGDRLFLEYEASRDLHVYVLAEDDHGEAFLLFPLPGHAVSNPLPGDAAHRLPPDKDGRTYSWGVSSAGGTEHLLIVASPKALTEFEATLAMLPTPQQSRSATAIPLDREALSGLRGIGLLHETDQTTEATKGRIAFTMARRLSGDSERNRGIWVRQIDLINPGR